MADISSSKVTHPVGHIDPSKRVDPKKKRQEHHEKPSGKHSQKKKTDDDGQHIDVFV